MSDRECPPGCGACCDPVVLPYSRAEVQRSMPGEWDDPRTRDFVLNDLTPIRRRDGLQRAAYLSSGVTVLGAPGTPGAVVLAWSFFYECRHFDQESRRCTNYEGRPDVCREYPWYGEAPDPAKALPVECIYRDDLDGCRE